MWLPCYFLENLLLQNGPIKNYALIQASKLLSIIQSHHIHVSPGGWESYQTQTPLGNLKEGGDTVNEVNALDITSDRWPTRTSHITRCIQIKLMH